MGKHIYLRSVDECLSLLTAHLIFVVIKIWSESSHPSHVSLSRNVPLYTWVKQGWGFERGVQWKERATRELRVFARKCFYCWTVEFSLGKEVRLG